MSRLRRLFAASLACGLATLTWAQGIGPMSMDAMPEFSVSGLFQTYKPSIFQIVVINDATGQKTSIGSGFVVGDGTLLATNYHVVSDAVQESHHHLEYVDSQGKKGKLSLLNVDVVHDLALVKADHKLAMPLIFGSTPAQGDSLYSLGDPHDLGFIIINGINNGLLQRSARARILFSGSLNAGMSGGPTLDKDGRVVGVNVSYLASGNNISFIVPVDYLQKLLTASEAGNVDINQSITQQLFADNAHYYGSSLTSQWPTTKIGHFRVPLAMRDDVRCWDSSPQTDADDLVAAESVTCFNDRSTFINEQVSIGQMGYSFTHYHAHQPISTTHFYRLYSKANKMHFTPRPRRDYGDFECKADFVTLADKPFKLTLCSEPSRHFKRDGEAIEDVRAVAAELGNKDSGLVINVALEGVQASLGDKVIQHLLEQITWQK